jgi:hypothetical protein
VNPKLKALPSMMTSNIPEVRSAAVSSRSEPAYVRFML